MIILNCLWLGISSCDKERIITVTATQKDTNFPVGDVKIRVEDVEHSDDGEYQEVGYTDKHGKGIVKYRTWRGDAIRVTLTPDSNHPIIGDNRFWYYKYQRNININVTTK